MVADDHIYPQRIGKRHFLHGLDTAVYGNDQRYAFLFSEIDTFGRYSVTFVISVRYVEFHEGSETAYERM